VQYAAGRLELPEDLQKRLPALVRRGGGEASRKVLDAGERLERGALAGVVAHPQVAPLLAELSPEHFDSDLHRRLHKHLVEPAGVADAELVVLLAELDARANSDGIDEETARQLLLRLHERQLRRELTTAGPERTLELQGALTKIREAVGGLG
jgi:hypothetical protein